MTRHPVYALLVASTLLLAGCAGGISGTPADPTATSAGPTATPEAPTATTGGAESPTTGAAGTGTVAFYVSDEENAIGDFEHVNVTVAAVGFQRGGEAGGWIEHDVDNVTVDLTDLQGPRSAYVDSYDLPNGEYSTVFIYVDDVHATLDNGEEVRVKLPSEKLQLETGFSLANGSEVEFVFDVTVKKAGNSGKYILQPVITESGTDVPIESTDDDQADEDDREDDDENDEEGDVESDDEADGSDLAVEAVGTVSAGDNATLVVTRNGSAVENATVTVDDVNVGTTDADGELTFSVPESDTVTVVVEADDDVVELEYEFE